ncbi:DUF2577 domain-containing protein [Paenibacillus pinisoli]|uniref:DUF2577 domain-containing protein n=1 Tax=Paenibacillus pinisoli TaxID=1276110 RepID=A0A3A6Q252_9BACL|nr:DUF2577 domain-containing protein [Paenibacillus pinisoli]RJX40054.1 DUF2577 domain-containing protein [Paenibacillus pinisoli]
MADLLTMIKQAAKGAVDASNPTAVLFAEVTNINPLKVNVDQRFTLPADFLVVPESLTRLEIRLGEPIVIRRGLELGDKVLLLRVQGGQQYIILDRMVSGNDT